MKDISEMTPIELNKYAETTKNRHEILKGEIINMTHEIEKLENSVNLKIEELKIVEGTYVKIVEELDNR